MTYARCKLPTTFRIQINVLQSVTRFAAYPPYDPSRLLCAHPAKRDLDGFLNKSSVESQRRLCCFMPRSEDRNNSRAPVKRRKLSRGSTAADTLSTPTMTRAVKEPLATVPRSIELTPIEETLRTLLLDVVEFIRRREPKQNDNQQSTPVAGLELRFTGGWVRDKLLGVGSHDIDVGISTMTGYQFGLALKDYLDVPGSLEKYKSQHLDKKLRAAMVNLHKIEANPEKSKHLETVTTKIFGLDIDLVNLRKEKYSDDSRNPEMEFGTPEEDALRRDATVNAMFYNLRSRSLEDFTGRGLDDMRKKLIRTPLPPYQTFKDDPLRVLRLIRFASRLGYTIDEGTESSMRHEDIKSALKAKISPERIGTEVEKTLKGPDPRGALETINQLGLYNTIFANHRDETVADTSTWKRAFNSLPLLLGDNPDKNEDLQSVCQRIRDVLIGDAKEGIYFCWVLASLAPWGEFLSLEPKKRAKPLPPLSVAVAWDSLRFDNKTLGLLTSSVNCYQDIISLKASIVEGSMPGTEAEIRQNVGQAMRQWGPEWRLCVVHAMLLDMMKTNDTEKVFRSYDKFLTYVLQKNLAEVASLKPLINGRDLTKAFEVKPGPWVTQALEIVINWQLRNPGRSDKEGPMEEVLSRKDELNLNNSNARQKP